MTSSTLAISVCSVRAPDTDVMAAVRKAGRCVVSVDTDFGELLAIGGHTGPSVVLLRRAPHRADSRAKLLLAALDQVEADLEAGAVVVLGGGRARVRRLPIEPESG
jgi:predicted nuclease of predicted toxin-antitoxin system